MGIFHSAFELVLLPTKLLAWASRVERAAISGMFHAEVWGFIFLHAALILGFAAGLWRSRGAGLWGSEAGQRPASAAAGGYKE